MASIDKHTRLHGSTARSQILQGFFWRLWELWSVASLGHRIRKHVTCITRRMTYFRPCTCWRVFHMMCESTPRVGVRSGEVKIPGASAAWRTTRFPYCHAVAGSCTPHLNNMRYFSLQRSNACAFSDPWSTECAGLAGRKKTICFWGNSSRMSTVFFVHHWLRVQMGVWYLHALQSLTSA